MNALMTFDTGVPFEAPDSPELREILERIAPDDRARDLLTHLQGLLAAHDRNDFRRAFGHLVRRWLRRLGLKLSTPSPFDGSDSLYMHLYELALIGEDPSSICYVLGVERRVLRDYWLKDIFRLVAVLDFLTLDAEQVLAEMQETVPGYPELKPSETDPAVLALIDSFWYLHPTRRQIVPHGDNLADFGGWLQHTHFGPVGQKGKRGRQAAMARKLAGVFGWKTVPSSVEAGGASYHFCFSNLLKGRRYGWNLRTLPLLAEELGVPMEELVADYLNRDTPEHAKETGA